MADLNSQCISCIVGKQLNRLPINASENKRLEYALGVLKIVYSNADISAPEIIALITEYKNRLFGFSDDYRQVKEHFNTLMLEREGFYVNKIRESLNPLKTALKFALLGNYIDFGALDNVDEDRLLNIPNAARELDIDEKEYTALLKELEMADSLVYLTDNCGEIVLDKLFIKELKTAFPQLAVTVIVKGEPVLNDATLEDAAAIGLNKITAVAHNGCNIAGNPLKKISEEAKALIDSADIIISKGQANFETLNGCNKNIYYLFLCKCSLYSQRFKVPQFTGLFINEKRK